MPGQIGRSTLGVGVDEIDALVARQPVVDDACAALLAATRQRPAQFAQSARARNEIPGFGPHDERGLQPAQLVIGPMLIRELPKCRQFDAQLRVTIRNLRIA